MATFDSDRYLARIGHHGPTPPTIETLRALHRAHLLRVPFENLDIGLGRPIVQDEGTLFDKIVVRRRGGFCYELNGLFAALLRDLGFRVTLLAAGVRRRLDAAGPAFGPEGDHLTLRVELDAPWLADVGFGDAFVHPLRLDTDAEQIDGGRDAPLLGPTAEGVWQDRYRFRGEGEWRILQRVSWDGAWHDRYRFTLAPRQPADFAAMCHYHQTSPESGFTKSRTCTIATPDGRITIAEDRLIVTRDGRKEETILSDEAARVAAIARHCGIVIGEDRAG